jgi:hypothetical protein
MAASLDKGRTAAYVKALSAWATASEVEMSTLFALISC